MATRVGGIKSLHWRYAILTAIRLRNSEGLVENDVLEALKITLHPPSPPTAASPELIDSIWSFISEDDEVAVRQIYIEQTRTNSSSQIAIGSSNCEYLLRAYKNMSIRTYVKGYCKTEWVNYFFGTWNVYADHNHNIKKPLLGDPTDKFKATIIIPRSD